MLNYFILFLRSILGPTVALQAGNKIVSYVSDLSHFCPIFPLAQLTNIKINNTKYEKLNTTLMYGIREGGSIAIFPKIYHPFPLIITPPVCDFEIFEKLRTTIFRKCPLILSFSCIFWLFLRFFRKIFQPPLLIITPPVYPFQFFFQTPPL